MTSRHISFKIIKFVGMMKVTLIGAGNLATQLGKSLKKAGVNYQSGILVVLKILPER